MAANVGGGGRQGGAHAEAGMDAAGSAPGQHTRPRHCSACTPARDLADSTRQARVTAAADAASSATVYR